MSIKPKVFKKMTALLTSTIEAGVYEVRIADTQEEIQAAQKLRYKVLFKEGGGEAPQEMKVTGLDCDEWDEAAFHVIVKKKTSGDIVGTIRLVSVDRLKEGQNFYTEKAFNINGLRGEYDSMLELSRACVESGKRGGVILLLMWRFCMKFIIDNGYEVMLGCASFQSTDYQKHAPILKFLYENNLANDDLLPTPIVENYIDIAEIDYDKDNLEHIAASGKRAQIPTMLRGYLKIGARVSQAAIIDPVFNTTFLCIYVDAKEMLASNHALVPAT